MALIVGGTTVTGTQTLDATKLTGNIADARVPSSAVTQHVSAVTTATGTWSPSASSASFAVHSARYVRVGNLVHCNAWLTSNASDPGTNANKWTISGLPITSVNTGTSNHVVGWGSFHGAGDSGISIMAWVQSNSTTIDFGSGSGLQGAMLPNATSPSNNSQGLNEVEGVMGNYNVRGPMANNNYMMGLGLSYYV